MTDDDEALARYSDDLLRAIESAVAPWVDASVRAVLLSQGRAVADDAAALIATAGIDATRAVVAQLRAMLSLDIDEQRQNPLSILRSAVRYPTGVLQSLGAQPVARDEFDARAFPDDVYALTPAAFSDFGPAVHEAGITWGAAKAHLHLQRRRSARPREIVVFAPDLMDRSRISAVLPQARFVATADELQQSGPGSLVLVDLHRPGALDVIPKLTGSVIGFASHVDDDLIRAGREAGCTEVLPRSRFFRRLPELGAIPTSEPDI